MSVGFVLLTRGISLYIFSDVRSEAQPPEFSGDELAGFKVAGVAGGLMVMAALEDGFTEGVVVGDVDTSLVGKDSGLHLPVGEAGTEGERDILVHRLEGLEYKGVARGGRLNVVGECDVDDVDT
jgi:hypothetical protein